MRWDDKSQSSNGLRKQRRAFRRLGQASPSTAAVNCESALRASSLRDKA